MKSMCVSKGNRLTFGNEDYLKGNEFAYNFTRVIRKFVPFMS